MRTLRASLLSLALVAVATGAPASQAHDQPGCGLTTILVVSLLPGECYTSVDADCDPDYDAEHARAYPKWFSRGGSNGFLPHSGCGLNFEDVHFPTPTRAVALLGHITGYVMLAKYEVRLLVDGVVVQRATFDTAPCECVLVYPFDAGLTIPPPLPLTLELLEPTIAAGTHDLRIEYTVLRGPAYMNLFVDDLLFLDPTICGILNNVPAVPGIGVDGLGGGLPFGWAGVDYPYEFTALAGGAQETLWRVNGQPLVPGGSLEHAFATAGAQGVELVAQGLPVLQSCPGAPPLPEGLPLTASIGRLGFTTLPGFDVDLLRPAPGEACVDGRTYRLPAGTAPVLALACTLSAEVDLHEAPVELVTPVTWAVDAQPFAEAAPGAEIAFQSLEHATGPRVMGASVGAVGDKFARVFTDTQEFLNLGAAL